MGTMQTLFVLVINSIAYGIFMFYDKEVVDQTKYKSHLVQTHTKHVCLRLVVTKFLSSHWMPSEQTYLHHLIRLPPHTKIDYKKITLF